MYPNISEAMKDIEFPRNSASSTPSSCNHQTISTSNKMFPAGYPMKKLMISSEEYLSQKAADVKKSYISNMKYICEGEVSSRNLYRHHDIIKENCLNCFQKVLKENQDEEFVRSYNFQRQRLIIEFEKAFVDFYNKNKNKDRNR